MARITLDALRLLEWWLDGSGRSREGDRTLLLEVIDSISIDSWRNGRWHCPYDAANDVYDCQPRAGLHLLLYEEPGGDGEWQVGIRSIHEEIDEPTTDSGMPF